MPPVRALVIGAGETSNLVHLPVLARLRDKGRLALVEICDLRRERARAAQQRFGFARASGDGPAAVQRGDVDAVYLFAEAQLHHRYGLLALEAGKHLFVEKPVAPNYAHACALVDAARERGLIAAGGHNRRFWRSLSEIRARGGKAGWRSAEAVFHKPALGQPPPFGARTWLSANGVHALDALVFLMGGLPEQMTAFAEGESFTAVMRWPDGAQGAFLCNNQAGARRETYAFHAPGHSVFAGEDGLRIEGGSGSSFIAWPALGDGFDAEHAAFLDAIDEGVEPIHSLARLAPSLRLAELIENGFSGRIEWPKTRPVRLIPATAANPRGPLLVVNAGSLKGALAANPPDRPLVALEDVLQTPGARPDIQAALLGTGPLTLEPEVLDRLPNLAVVGLAGLSFARHRPDRLLARGVTLVNASTVYAESVAEFAFALAVLARRRAFVSDRIMRSGGWGVSSQPRGWRAGLADLARTLRPDAGRLGVEPILLRTWRRSRLVSAAAPSAPARELRGATAGLIGWGASASALAGRLAAAGAQVLAWSEHATCDQISETGAVPASLAEALAADVVSLHRGLTPATRHFLGAAELARLRPGAVLINVARSGLIEPEALRDRLCKGDVFACLDSFEQEPPLASDPLRKMANVFLTSHIAAGSADMQVAAVQEVLAKIDRRLLGAVADVVTPERLRTMT